MDPYYYLCEREQTALEPKGIRLADSEIPSEEIDDPYPESIPESIQPLGAFKPVQQFCLPERTGPHGGERTVFNVRVAESDFMRYSKSQDASPVALASVLMYKTIQSLHPENDLPIVCGMAHSIREELGKPLAHQSLAPVIHLKYPVSLFEADITKLSTCTRGMIMVQSQLENMLVQIRNNLKTIERLRGMTHAQKRELMQGAAQRLGSDTFKVSYVGRMDWGALEPYIQRIYTNVDVYNSGIMLEIMAANGAFDFSFLQEFPEDVYVRRFMELLEGNGISTAMTGPSPLLLAGIQLDSQ